MLVINKTNNEQRKIQISGLTLPYLTLREGVSAEASGGPNAHSF